MKRAGISALLVALAMLASACGGDEPSAQPSNPPTTTGSPTDTPLTSSPTTTPGRTGRTVDVIDNAYSPAELTVTVGTEVIWSYVGPDAPHSVTAADGSFNSNPNCNPSTVECMKVPGDAFRFTFTKAGRFPYACLIHGELMSGTIVVE